MISLAVTDFRPGETVSIDLDGRPGFIKPFSRKTQKHYLSIQLFSRETSLEDDSEFYASPGVESAIVNAAGIVFVRADLGCDESRYQNTVSRFRQSERQNTVTVNLDHQPVSVNINRFFYDCLIDSV